MSLFGIPHPMLEKMKSQAEKEYPNECCGVILGPKALPHQYSRLWPCRNVQDQYHSKDPANFPRTAKNAYFLDPQELLRLQKDARSHEEEIKVIYHSHIDAPGHFSEEDYRMAIFEGSPVYPEVRYLIFSICSGKFSGANLFVWNPGTKKYQETAHE